MKTCRQKQKEGQTAAQITQLACLTSSEAITVIRGPDGRTDGVYLKALPKEFRALFKAGGTRSFMNRAGRGEGGGGSGALLSIDEGRRSAHGTLLKPCTFVAEGAVPRAG